MDHDIARTSDRMREELRSRYGIDVETLGADPAAVRNAMTRAEQSRVDAAEVRSASADDYAQAAALLASADELDGQALERDRTESVDDKLVEGLSREELAVVANITRDDGAIAYDSAERRNLFAADMEEAGVALDLQTVRLVADRNNGTHPSASVAKEPGKQPKARNRTRSPGLQRERGGLSR